MRDKRNRPDSEKDLQNQIINELQQRGYRVGTPDMYDRQRALVTEDLIEFLQVTQGEEYQRIKQAQNGHTAEAIADRVGKAISQQGTLRSFKKGVTVAGGGLRGQATLRLVIFPPNHHSTPQEEERARKNILRVIPEVVYSPHGDKGRLDLVLFLNGIPWCTIEIKTDFKQTSLDGMQQYRETRRPGSGRKAEPLLTPGRGALVHLVVSNLDVRMTTELRGEDTVFLPLNKGDGDHAGNPSIEVTGKMGTSHLWEELLLPENVLELIRHFIVEKKGSKGKADTVLFPRWHQRRAVKAIKAHILERGPGQRYLVQHSAGSGKTNTIAWLALQLQQLYYPDGTRAFDSVIVVSDRNQLDAQLQAAITAVDERGGNVENINRVRGSKKAALARALAAGAPIIVVTQQSFPSLLELIEESKAARQAPQGEKRKDGLNTHQLSLLGDLSKQRYAIIADEAHGSQAGESARKRDASLGGEMSEEGPGDGQEGFIESFGTDPRASRYPNLTIIALTATPKAVTLRSFGTPVPGEDSFKAFDTYSMRQAIEEEFILDVLSGYTSYQTAWEIKHVTPDKDIVVDEREATREIIRWVELSPQNISQKCNIILEHYHRNVAHLLGGQARAMIVTGSRQAARDYALEMRRQIIQGGLPFKVLVAFSGKLEHHGQQVTERELNPGMAHREVADEFDEDGQNFIVVANKYTTGFDQPRLCALYLDRRVSGVAAVQTLSRLNRTYPGKDRTFVLDFANSPEVIAESFAKFLDGASVVPKDDVIGIQLLADEIRQLGIINEGDVDQFDALMQGDERPEKGNEQLMKLMEPARRRFRERQEEAHDSDAREEIEQWRDSAQRFAKAYDFVDALHDLRDQRLHRLARYLKQLLPMINDRKVMLELPDLEIMWVASKQQQTDISIQEAQAKPLQHGNLAGRRPVQEGASAHINAIIDELNSSLQGSLDTEGEAIVDFSNSVMRRLADSRKLQAQALDNTEDEFIRSRTLRDLISDLILDMQKDNNAIYDQVLDDRRIFNNITEAFGRAHYRTARQNMEE